MSMETIHDLFERGREDSYHAKHQLLDALEELESNTDRDEIAQAFADHHNMVAPRRPKTTRLRPTAT